MVRLPRWDGRKFLEWTGVVVIIGVMSAVTVALYLLILTIISAAIAQAAMHLGGSLSDSLRHQTPGNGGELNSFQVFLYALLPMFVFISMPIAGFSKVTREKLRKYAEQSSGWLVKLGELILLAAVFQLAAQKKHLWSIQALAFLMFLCLSWHTVRPIWRFIIQPVTSSAPPKKWARIIIGLFCFVVGLAMTLVLLSSLNVGLKALLDAGAVNTP